MISKPLRTLAIVFGALAALLVVAWVALPLVVTSGPVRSAIIAQMSTLLGHQVELAGDLSLKLFPRPVATLTRVIVPGAGDEPLLTIETLDAELALGSLFSRNMEVSAMRIVRPEMKLTADERGLFAPFGQVARAVDMRRAAGVSPVTEAASAETPEAFNLPSGFPANVGLISVEGGQITFAGDDGTQPGPVTAINGTLEWPRMDRPFSATGTAVWNGAPVSVTAKAQAPLDVLAGGISAVQVSAASELGTLRYNGLLSDAETMFADGTFAFETPSGNALLKWLNLGIEPSQDLGAIKLEGPVKLSNRKARFENAIVSFAGSDGTGVFELSLAKSDTPSISGTLDFTTLDLGQFLSAFVVVPEDTTDTQPITHELRSQMNADLRISAKSASFGTVALTDLAATAQVAQDVAIFDIGDGKAYGGNVQARLQLTPDTWRDKADIILSGENIDLGMLAKGMALPQSLPTGIANVSVTAVAPAGSWNTIAQNATGTMTLRMAQGSLPGMGISSLLAREAGQQFFVLSSADAPAEPFTSLQFKCAITDGVMAIEDASVTYPAGTLSFNGVLPYRSGGIAMTAIATPAKEGEAPARYFIGGSWDRAFATRLPPAPPAIQ